MELAKGIVEVGEFLFIGESVVKPSSGGGGMVIALRLLGARARAGGELETRSVDLNGESPLLSE